MWRLEQVPKDVVSRTYGVQLTDVKLRSLQDAVVRLMSPGGSGTGTFASANGLILTNHHVALDCIRTSTLAEQNKAGADNLIDNGFTAASRADELPCKRFQAQIERSATDVTAQVNAGVKPGMAIADVQRVRQAARSDLERVCATEKGDRFTCSVVDFNSGATSLLMVYEDYKDLRLVYAPEKQLGYFGGDEMNFRFPRYVSDISILRAYAGADGSHGEFDAAHVPYAPSQHLHVTMAGVKEGDFTLVAGYPGNTNRYRESYSARYNLRKGIPDQIRDLETHLALLQKHAAAKPEYRVALQSRIFELSNTLKYQKDVLAALAASEVVADRERREREFTAFLATRPELQKEFGGVLAAQAAVYANDVEANADLDAALGWFDRSDLVGYAIGLNDFAIERAKASDRDREPEYQQRNWPAVRDALLSDDPVIAPLEEDVLAVAFERALALTGSSRIPAVQTMAEQAGGRADARAMAHAIVSGTELASVELRKRLVDATPDALEASTDSAIVFARALKRSLDDRRQRVRILNEKLLGNRSAFARGLAAWKGASMYPDANLTLRFTFGHTAGYTDLNGKAIPFATRFGGLFALAQSRSASPDFALPRRLQAWRTSIGDTAFRQRYADMIVNFVTTNDITGGNSGSATLNRSFEIVGLIFDGNEEAMAGDWTYSGKAGRALSTDIRFALTVAREVHGAGWIVDELLAK